jgi:hypothetical protein
MPERYTVGLSSGALRGLRFSQTATTVAVTRSSLPVVDTLSVRQKAPVLRRASAAYVSGGGHLLTD